MLIERTFQVPITRVVAEVIASNKEAVVGRVVTANKEAPRVVVSASNMAEIGNSTEGMVDMANKAGGR